MTLVVREILTYPPGRHEFDPDEFPWAVAIRAILICGRGGAAVDGTPGTLGETVVAEIQKPERLTLNIGAGKPGSDGGHKGDDALGVIQLYVDEPEEQP